MASADSECYDLNMQSGVTPGVLNSAETLAAAGRRRAGLEELGRALRGQGASHLGRLVERAALGNVGGFSVDDIETMGNLSEDQAEAVMQELGDRYDPSVGMNWDDVRECVAELFPEALAAGI